MQLLTPQDLADLAHIPIRTLDNWAYQNKGPTYIRVGRHRRYLPADVDAWLAANRRGGVR